MELISKVTGAESGWALTRRSARNYRNGTASIFNTPADIGLSLAPFIFVRSTKN